MRSLSLFLIALGSSLLDKSLALDVEIDNFVCNDELYVTLQSLELDCNGNTRCTFGDYVMVKGTMIYNGLQNSGLYADGNADEQYMYLEGDLSTWTVEYDLMHFYPMPVCWEYAAEQQQQQQQQQQDNGGDDGDDDDDDGDDAGDGDDDDDGDDGNDNGRRALARTNRKLGDEQQECPADGVYSFYVQYRLPNTDNEAISWMTTGWEGHAKFYMYAKSYENGGEDYPIGECQVAVATSVTASSESGFLQTPSAATTAGIVLATLAALSLLCMYCYCCVRRKKRKFETDEGDDITSSFRRMETDDDEKVNVDGQII